MTTDYYYDYHTEKQLYKIVLPVCPAGHPLSPPKEPKTLAEARLWVESQHPGYVWQYSIVPIKS